MLLNLDKLKEKYSLNIKGILNIGANSDNEKEYEMYKRLDVKNTMFFEPLPHVFEKLKNSLVGKSILVNTALGNTIGTIEMNVETANKGMSSSILEPSLHLQQYPHIQFTNKMMVNITKLDTFIEEKNNYNMINIDVQGYELEVFKGASEFLNYIDYIIAEVNRDELYKGCARVEEIDDYLKKYAFERVETTWDGITWGDALYIKK